MAGVLSGDSAFTALIAYMRHIPVVIDTLWMMTLRSGCYTVANTAFESVI